MFVPMVVSIAEIRKVFETVLKGFQRRGKGNGGEGRGGGEKRGRQGRGEEKRGEEKKVKKKNKTQGFELLGQNSGRKFHDSFNLSVCRQRVSMADDPVWRFRKQNGQTVLPSVFL